jgi:hypothetical protein
VTATLLLALRSIVERLDRLEAHCGITEPTEAQAELERLLDEEDDQ